VNGRALIALYRLAFAVATIAAVLVQTLDLAGKGTLDVVNFFSYFTIQSNLIGVAVFLVGAARWQSGSPASWDLVRGGSVVYLTVTFVVFALLLSNTDVDTAVPWVNTVVHEIFPIAVIADWLIDPPVTSFTLRRALLWLVYPLAWTGYVLIRGAIVGKYPYPFLDPANGGYGTVALYVVAILVFGVLLCAIYAWVGNVLGARRRRETSEASRTLA
jgi:hypothetical protein